MHPSPRPLWIRRRGSIASQPGPTGEKLRAELKSDQVEVRRVAIGMLVHSDLSASLRVEIQAALKDSDAQILRHGGDGDRQSRGRRDVCRAGPDPPVG